MHFQQGTRTFDSPQFADEAIALVWEKKGFARRDDDTSLTIVADAGIFPDIRLAIDELCKSHADAAVQAQTAAQIESGDTTTTQAPPV